MLASDLYTQGLGKRKGERDGYEIQGQNFRWRKIGLLTDTILLESRFLKFVAITRGEGHAPYPLVDLYIHLLIG